AELLDMAIHKVIDNGYYMQIDVGGGSTEINMIKGKQSYARKSFKLGSVRNMQGRDKPATWEAMESWIKDHTQGAFDAVVATGGNIRTLYKLWLDQGKELITPEDLQQAADLVARHSWEERIELLGLREDRADVLPYAAKIYSRAIAASGAGKIMVPNVGLKDGIIEMLIQRNF
ncbi:MAG TPA: phosphatase, partial [Flammeovirgaceae bacterium]|nr:phosphatase [Flammeovirgaceae bacterium]